MCYFNAFVIFFPLNSFEDVESETFIVPLSVERVELRIPTTFVVLPQRLGLCALVSAGSPQRPRRASREKAALRPHAAALGGALRPRRGCGASALQRRRGGRQDEQRPGASIPGRRQTSSLADLGQLRRLFRD